ncbi:MAG TPA: TolC family protein [Thiolapillus brandeum]|uniref:TolC family protein n=1 Tax=Thiolapillus brandeum TaxID=1076588 RepID=A0A7C5N6R7_9GAMM|nr:TolC family protein [Thiolapillus brandeum]
MKRTLLLAGGLWWAAAGWCGDGSGPLTLERALELAEASHPAIALANARAVAAEAELRQVEASDDLTFSLEGRLAYLEPARLSNFRERNDSSAQLRVEKRLYDFGYTEAREASAARRLEAARAALLDARQAHLLKVMRAFFDVLLADLEYARDNEAMSVAFVRLDKARQRHELGRVSDLELSRLEDRYQQILVRRTASEARQRETRLKLALAINRPESLPGELVEPDPPRLDGELPDLSRLLEEVLQDNPRLRELRADVEAAEQALVAAGRRYGPVLRGEVAAGAWNRETRSTHPFEAALVLELPLYSGDRGDAEAAAARSRLLEAQARLDLSRHELRQQVTELWLELQQLQRRARALMGKGGYRDLYLDRSRTLYDLERATDLGDAMVRISEVKLEVARVHYQWLLDQARLRALAGRLLQGEEG